MINNLEFKENDNRLYTKKQFAYFNFMNIIYYTEVENFYDYKLKTLNAFKRAFKDDYIKEFNINSNDIGIIKEGLKIVKNRIFTGSINIDKDNYKDAIFKYIAVEPTVIKELDIFNVLYRNGDTKEIQGTFYKSKIDFFNELKLFIVKDKKQYKLYEYFTGSLLITCNKKKDVEGNLKQLIDEKSISGIKELFINLYKSSLNNHNNKLINGETCNYSFIKINNTETKKTTHFRHRIYINLNTLKKYIIAFNREINDDPIYKFEVFEVDLYNHTLNKVSEFKGNRSLIREYQKENNLYRIYDNLNSININDINEIIDAFTSALILEKNSNDSILFEKNSLNDIINPKIKNNSAYIPLIDINSNVEEYYLSCTFYNNGDPLLFFVEYSEENKNKLTNIILDNIISYYNTIKPIDDPIKVKKYFKEFICIIKGSNIEFTECTPIRCIDINVKSKPIIKLCNSVDIDTQKKTDVIKEATKTIAKIQPCKYKTLNKPHIKTIPNNNSFNTLNILSIDNIKAFKLCDPIIDNPIDRFKPIKTIGLIIEPKYNLSELIKPYDPIDKITINTNTIPINLHLYINKVVINPISYRIIKTAITIKFKVVNNINIILLIRMIILRTIINNIFILINLHIAIINKFIIKPYEAI